MASTIYYLKGEQTGEVLDAYFKAVMEWLKDEQFAEIQGRMRIPAAIGYILLAPAGAGRADLWHLYYDTNGVGKDALANAIVIAKVCSYEGPIMHKPAGSPHHVIVSHYNRFFQCDLGDPNLWERTLNALRAFRYTHWPVAAKELAK